MVAGDRMIAPAPILAVWGEVIRRYRVWLGLSRRDLAQRAGISAVFLGEIERGQKEASIQTLQAVAVGLGIPLSELYLRVAARLEGQTGVESHEQTSLPLGVREDGAEYLQGVPRALDETAFDLYRVARTLRSDHQVSLLVLAQSLARR